VAQLTRRRARRWHTGHLPPCADGSLSLRSSGVPNQALLKGEPPGRSGHPEGKGGAVSEKG
jgi:hypothetical protein